jgi:hypothetical protein
MRAQDIMVEHPGMFQVSTNRLQSESLALLTDAEGKVLAVEAQSGSVVEKDGKPLFAYNDGYYKSKQVALATPGVVVLKSSIQATEVELGSQVLRLVHKYQDTENPSRLCYADSRIMPRGEAEPHCRAGRLPRGQPRGGIIRGFRGKLEGGQKDSIVVAVLPSGLRVPGLAL